VDAVSLCEFMLPVERAHGLNFLLSNIELALSDHSYCTFAARIRTHTLLLFPFLLPPWSRLTTFPFSVIFEVADGLVDSPVAKPTRLVFFGWKCW
jgi:hypothetical protein